MASSRAGLSNMQNEWVRMLYQEGYLNVLKLHAFEGEVKRKSQLRSVCWKLFLEVLPEDQSLWAEYSRKGREEYDRVKKKFIVDPHDAQTSVDLAKNNPLSQEEESPWHQYFQDEELKRTIQTDVVRTFPDELYFAQDYVRESMSNLLFCYGKEHPETSYRQGMHELLAPIMFVLQSSQLDEEQLQLLPLELRVVLDPQYIEHDAFCMFSVLMETMQGWYMQGPQRNTKFKSAVKFDLQHSRPFDNCRHKSQLPNVSYKLEKIHSVLLKRFDPEVHQRLVELDVAPEVYGIRWIRLLFSREFPFLTTLDLWDAIFAEGNTLEIVDYLYIAMLINIKGQLLYQGNGYTQCMGLLMNYPGRMEVQEIVQLARHLRYPKLVPPPDMVDNPLGNTPEGQFMNREESKAKEQTARKEVQKRVKNADWSGVTGRPLHDHSKKPHSSSVTRSGSHSSRPADKVPSTRSHPETVVPVALAIDQAGRINTIAETVGEELAQNPHQHRGRPHSSSKVEQLEQRLDDLETLRKYCGSKMDAQLDILQHAVYANELNVEECGDVYTALAELKQVRDLLLGQLTFSGAVMDLSAPPTSYKPSHTATHSREGNTQEVGHATGRHRVDHTGRTNTGTASDDDILNSPTHPHPTHPHQCEALSTDDSAPPSLSLEAHPFPLPPSPGASEESPSSASCPQLEEVEGEQQDADLLSDYTVLSITPSVVGSGDGRSHDSHVTGGEEAQ